mmetsp:Transcript_19602/g.33642  ORF Transcript_19602/g.33642 Transcript_19602/m.33642 type:complete len:87 (-) Transcript_19602:720-980(-)
MGLKEDFEQAAADVKNFKELDNNELLELYGLFKQATVGDCDTDRPGMFDMKGKAKWDAWNGKKGKSKDDAMKEYIQYVGSLKAKYT